MSCSDRYTKEALHQYSAQRQSDAAVRMAKALHFWQLNPEQPASAIAKLFRVNRKALVRP